MGIYFVTQNPRDIPDSILAQLGNKIEHALHAYTPAEQKAAKAAAMSFRENPDFDTYDTLLSLGTGEALVSVLDEKGVPTIVEKTSILPPQSLMGPIDDSTREKEISSSILFSRYNDYFDRDSAYEFLQRNKAIQEAEAEATKPAVGPKVDKNSMSYKTAKAAQSVAKTASGTVGREVGKTVGNAIGGKFGKTLGGNIGSSIGRNFLGVFFKS